MPKELRQAVLYVADEFDIAMHLCACGCGSKVKTPPGPTEWSVGEIRGGEAFDLLQLLNTGHSGTISTVHANSAAHGISRFTTCVLQSGIEMPYRAIKANIAESLNVVVQMERRPGARFISGVSEIF